MSLSRSTKLVTTAGVLVAAMAASPALSSTATASAQLIGHHGTTIFAPIHGATKVSGTALRTRNITYHNGPIITGTTNVYEIWYGNWSTVSTPARQGIVDRFLRSDGGSPYFNINTTYYNSAGVHVTNAVNVAGSTTDSYSQGKALSDAAVQSVVAAAISAGHLPSDSNALYFVLTSSDVTETSGFLTKYCGWHSNGTIGTANIKYSFVGDPTANLAACSGQSGTSPNGDVAGDDMTSVVAHELEETVTDPLGNAWYDSSGAENGDKCAWNFGTTYKAPNGSLANMALTYNGTSYNYLIQQNWVASTQACALKY